MFGTRPNIAGVYVCRWHPKELTQCNSTRPPEDPAQRVHLAVFYIEMRNIIIIIININVNVSHYMTAPMGSATSVSQVGS